jgi:hypothetical protein
VTKVCDVWALQMAVTFSKKTYSTIELTARRAERRRQLQFS